VPDPDIRTVLLRHTQFERKTEAAIGELLSAVGAVKELIEGLAPGPALRVAKLATAADKYDMSELALRRLIGAGEIRSVVLHGRVRYVDLASIEAYWLRLFADPTAARATEHLPPKPATKIRLAQQDIAPHGNRPPEGPGFWPNGP
jgi:hypothetical protein